jgi:hypothetical protein
MDVSGNRDAEGQNVHFWKRHGGRNQRWRVIYHDRQTKEVTKGLHRGWGFHVNRPFYFRSRLPMRRVAEVHGSNVTLRRYAAGRKRQ